MSNKNRLQHLAIIMDGNGRWAKQRGFNRTKGHEKGAEVVREITTYCSLHKEVETLTLYAFSTENWKRPKLEVEFLMKLIKRYLKKELPIYMKNNVKFETIGDLTAFSTSLRDEINRVKEKTKNNTSLTQILALNYGSKNEIVRAINRLIDKNIEVTDQSISDELDTPYDDIDLLIRTSGEHRLSNFLLWQTAYSELYFTKTLWPDFNAKELEKIIENYQNRERRFGGV